MEKNSTRQKAVSLWRLFITFLKVGAFTFGGGYAMIAILQDELVAKKQWITDADMLDMIVIAESTPGVIAVNTATSVGFKLRGVLGALVATLGVVLPSFCIIFGLSFAIKAFRDNVWYQAAFSAIQACVTILIVNAFVKMVKQLDNDVFSFLVMFAAFVVAVFTKFNVIFVILIGGVLGVCYSLIAEAIGKKKQRALPLENVERQGFENSSAGNDEQPTEEFSPAEVTTQVTVDNANIGDNLQSSETKEEQK